MAVKYTPDQQKVIDLRDSNILVSAAAGSGKTAVLTERIVNMVCDESKPVDIDRLLVVTFTNAAAAEMRERIGVKIAERMEANPLSEHIQKQAALIHNAQITTIDSFCLFLLRNHFQEIGIDPAFRIADSGEITLLSADVMQELMEARFASEDPAFRECVEFFCSDGKESALETKITDLAEFAASFPWPEKWLEERKEDYPAVESDFEQSKCGKYLVKYLGKMTAGWIEKLTRAKKLCEEPDGPHMYGASFDAEIEMLEKVQKCKTLEEFGSRLPAVNFASLSGARDSSVNKDKRKLAADIRNEVKESVLDAAAVFFKTSAETAGKRSMACHGPVSTLIDLTLDYMARMAEKKREKKIVTFSDVEHFALDILLRSDENGNPVPSDVALEYRKHFAEILIDEYQDSNMVQEYLLSAVSGEQEGNYNRFMVGDVKQSIYKFRLARPELFLEKYKSYTADGSCRRIDLSKNFRSRVQVVNTVNQVFERLMSDEVGRIEYDAAAALYPGAEYPENSGCESEYLLIEKPEKGAEENNKEREALAIANKIKALKKDFRVTDKTTGQLRDLKYSDIVILLRTTTGWDEPFKKVLESQGIPVFISSKSGYFNATEVQELLQVLAVLDNPRRDIPLYGCMKSVFGGFNEEEIALIRVTDRTVCLYEALQQTAAGEERTPLAEKAAAFLETLEKYRKYTVYMPIRELLTKLVTDFDYLNYVTALPAGSKRRANVELLFTKASDFEGTSYFGLFHFIRYMEQLQKKEVDFGEAEMLDENADVVRIMSIHKSKGLEFPVTFVSSLSKKFNKQDIHGSLLLDMDYGLGVAYTNPEKRVSGSTLRKATLACKLTEDMLAEELRVLYVALTRAKEKLILTGVVDKPEEQLGLIRQQASEHITYADFMESETYYDFLKPILGKTDIALRVVPADELKTEELTEQFEMAERREKLEHAADFSEPASAQELRDRLRAVYAYEHLKDLYTKTTVSELKIAAMAEKDEAAFHTFEEKEPTPYIPAFRREEEEVTGTVRGNAYHRAMELLDFGVLFGGKDFSDFEQYSVYVSEESFAQELHRFLEQEVSEKRLLPEYLQAVKEEKILRFLASPLGFRMWKAELEGKLYREQPFMLGIGANRVNSDFPEEEKVLVQGIIDVFWEEEDGIVLLDYKTDSVQSLDALWNRYATQLDYYGEALEKLMGQPVKEKYLYSFRLEKY